MSSLTRFLNRNSTDSEEPLPLIHTCESYFLKHILRDGAIKPAPCKIFDGEELAYFFVGRPAYKKELALEPTYWELPSCFVCEYDISGARRIYPFDTGAFKTYPNFISMANMAEFDLSADPQCVPKLIGTFFPDRLSYYRTKPRPEQEFLERYAVDVLDEEIRALHTLITTRMPKSPDDRRASIEVSFAHEIDLIKTKVHAVIIPEIYLESDKIMQYIELNLRAQPISYPIMRQNVNYYYSCIYSILETFYQKNGFFSDV